MLFELIFGTLFNFLCRKIRQWRLARYARSRACSFCPEDLSNSISFSQDIFPRNPSTEYKLSSAMNVIQGSLHGLKFTYFEKVLIADSGVSAGKPQATRSIITIDKSAGRSFASGETIDKDLAFGRENGGLYFWWNDPGSGFRAIPLSKLDRWLADVASTFHAEVSLASRDAEEWIGMP
ncbi:MAG TPA: hypothetical protein VF532_17485 [Candidatus Angelobacter sp.]